MDLYRISDPLEAWDLGLEEYLSGDGVCVIEWADQAEELFAEDTMWIDLDYPTREPAVEGPVVEVRAGLGQADSWDGDRTGLGEPAEAVGLRTITFGRHAPRYDPLLRELSGKFPRIESST